MLAVATFLAVAGAWYFGGIAALLFAGLAGGLLMLIALIWIMGGHASNLPWLWGIEGEQWTAEEIEKLGSEWHCEHDIDRGNGNWDHVLVGPPGVFLLDSKAFNNPSVARNDVLRSGRLVINGGRIRSQAQAAHAAIARQFEHVPWVQGVVVVWGEFAQGREEADKVVYIRGHDLVAWLSELPSKLDGPHRAAIVTALNEVRATKLGASS